MIDEFLERHSPESKQERREKRAAKRQEPTRPRDQGAAATHGRHIPASTRDAVFERDQGRCTYVGSSGKRCGSTRRLQIDHVVPYGRGGTNTVQNLRLLCGKHNRLEAERIYGVGALRRHRARE